MGSNAAGLGPWADARLPGSWRGLPFKVRESEIRRGRRTTVHEYPKRDTVWVEDLGRATRIIAFRGFLVGDDVDSQLKAMLDAAETDGEGTLVHPALGSMTASLAQPLVARDTVEEGRVWSLEFVFVTGASRSYPVTSVATQSAALTAADACDATTAGSFASVGTTLASAGATIQGGITDARQVVQGVRSTIGGYVSLAQGVVRDVNALGRSVAGLTGGNFGRFSLGARLGAIPGLTNATQAVTQANAAAASVSHLTGSLSNLVNAL